MANNGRQTSYAHEDNDASSKEERLKKLKTELREHIRFLGGYELLGQDWLRMAESLQQIANVAFMEQQMVAPSENPLDQQGKNREGTLWDQQKDELAIRILLEEGKLNLLLRLLHIYKEAMRQPDAAKVKLAAATQLGCDVRAIEARCRTFEFSVGQLLALALKHSEAIQIIDLPELLVHCKECVLHAGTSLSEEKKTDPSFDRCQESMILQYFGAMGANFEKLDEDRVMDLLDEQKLVPSLVAHLHSLAPHLAADHVAASFVFFSSIMGSDAYRTDADRFIAEKETKQQLLDLQAMFVPEMIKAHAVQKKHIQGLLDNLAKFERQVGKSGAKSQPIRMAALAPLTAV